MKNKKSFHIIFVVSFVIILLMGWRSPFVQGEDLGTGSGGIIPSQASNFIIRPPDDCRPRAYIDSDGYPLESGGYRVSPAVPVTFWFTEIICPPIDIMQMYGVGGPIENVNAGDGGGEPTNNVTYTWNFGDETTITTPTNSVVHTYWVNTVAGAEFPVTLLVNNGGNITQYETHVHVWERCPAFIQVSQGTNYNSESITVKAGEDILFNTQYQVNCQGQQGPTLAPRGVNREEQRTFIEENNPWTWNFDDGMTIQTTEHDVIMGESEILTSISSPVTHKFRCAGTYNVSATYTYSKYVTIHLPLSVTVQGGSCGGGGGMLPHELREYSKDLQAMIPRIIQKQGNSEQVLTFEVTHPNGMDDKSIQATLGGISVPVLLQAITNGYIVTVHIPTDFTGTNLLFVLDVTSLDGHSTQLRRVILNPFNPFIDGSNEGNLRSWLL